ncbi:AAA family ATPase [Staphylococcus caeli]|uniref:AAA family ATPase n=1 Tax=Staphylococcus caeli TaxID=2201815 RepID=UPI003F54838D
MNDDGDSYDFNYMSDGERQVFYFIANVLVNESDGYIIVDEPENHLNSQICKLLWDTLEHIKKDSTFVYITHDPKFAASRTKAKIIWSKSFKYPDEWEYKILENNEIPEELLIEVLGSKENIIFCEGNNESKDKRIYDSIFFEEKVIAVEGHLNVISYTNSINKIPNLNIEARGIIDRDGKTDEEVQKYKTYQIHVLPYNEVEMLLLSKDVLDEMNETLRKIGREIDIELLEKELFGICETNKDKIALNIVKSSVDNILSTQKIQSMRNIEEIQEDLWKIVDTINVEELYNHEIERLELLISNKDYDGLLKVCNLKNEVLKYIPNKLGQRDYDNSAIALIKNSESLQNKLKNCILE